MYLNNSCAGIGGSGAFSIGYTGYPTNCNKSPVTFSEIVATR
jgi:hypothetical protein